MKTEFKIEKFPFTYDGAETLISHEKGMDRPVVYLINNEKSIYIGETSSALNRFSQHLVSTEKKGLKWMNIIFDDTFNKSAILDIEQNLIQYFGADKKYEILNKNGGQSSKHNYYQREYYINKFDLIWEELKKLGLVNNDAINIRNSDLFKYSPYNTLTEEQEEVSKSIIRDMIKKLSKGEEGISVIKGGAGTGKTIVIINMMHKLINAMNIKFDKAIEEEIDLSEYIQLVHDIQEFITKYNNGKALKIAYVAQMDGLRNTIKFVFRNTQNGLKANMAMGPTHIVDDYYKTNEKFDIVFVDETHRLCQYKNITWRGAYKDTAIKCGMKPEDYTCLDFILHCSKYRVLVYDDKQTVKGSDITPEQFQKSLKGIKTNYYELGTQMRCKGGETYIQYVTDILNCKEGLKKQELENGYELKMYYNADKMINKIKNLDKEYGLCRNVCSESWERKTKGKKRTEIKANNLYDINIDNHGYVRNTCIAGWIISDNAINEIGCIHTVQGYDLNYVGLIFGQEIDYDKKTNKIIIDRSKFCDKYIKQGADDKTFFDYIINAYKVVMTRGIRGCYIYAYNKGLRDYLSKFIDKA